MPKVYCAFTKNIAEIEYYVPHKRQDGEPTLVYQAQGYEHLPCLKELEALLLSIGYDDFNYVTVVLYSGKTSGISKHRDRQQIVGYENASETIASFVVGATRYVVNFALRTTSTDKAKRRNLQLFVDDKPVLSAKNNNGTLYIMEGIQKYTEHSKEPAEGAPSISIIFRKLENAKYSFGKMQSFNTQIEIPWHDLAQTEACRKLTPDNFDSDVAMKTYWRTRTEFNVSCRHTETMKVLSKGTNGTASLFLRHLDSNQLNNDASLINYTCNNDHYSAKALKQYKQAKQLIRIYAPCRWFAVDDIAKNGILFLGNYFVTCITETTTNLQFDLSRNEQ